MILTLNSIILLGLCVCVCVCMRAREHECAPWHLREYTALYDIKQVSLKCCSVNKTQ